MTLSRARLAGTAALAWPATRGAFAQQEVVKIGCSGPL